MQLVLSIEMSVYLVCTNHVLNINVVRKLSRNFNSKHLKNILKFSVNRTSTCIVAPVTDTTMRVHASICDLIQSNSKLAYFGMYNDNICKKSGIVCGIDGVTYGSECEALSGEFKIINLILCWFFQLKFV